MATPNESTSTAALPPVVVTRTFAAPRTLAFAAWSSADHLKRWFCPAGYAVPEAEIEFRVGGAFNICMRSPQGEEHWIRGRYVEIVPESRLVIDMQVCTGPDPRAAALFRAHTAVTFSDEAAGTRLEVVQRYTLLQPAAAPMIQGAAQGWSQTLDRLEHELQRMARSGQAPDGSERSGVQ